MTDPTKIASKFKLGDYVRAKSTRATTPGEGRIIAIDVNEDDPNSTEYIVRESQSHEVTRYADQIEVVPEETEAWAEPRWILSYVRGTIQHIQTYQIEYYQNEIDKIQSRVDDTSSLKSTDETIGLRREQRFHRDKLQAAKECLRLFTNLEKYITTPPLRCSKDGGLTGADGTCIVCKSKEFLVIDLERDS